MKILILTAYYPPFALTGHDDRCRQVVEALAKRGHRLQVLTSNYRLPPLGLPQEKGVFRELILYDSADPETGLGISYKETVGHEGRNAQVLGYRLGRYRPDVIYVWNKRGLSKSMLFNLQAQGIPVVYDLHSNWLQDAVFDSDPWYRWWKRNSSLRSKAYQTFLKLGGSARRLFQDMPLGEPGDLDLKNAYVCSEQLRRELAEAGIRQADTMRVLHPAVDTTVLLGKAKFGDGKRFMWAGRLSEVKAPELALEALEILRAQGIRVELDYFGMGEPLERKRMRQRIDASTVADSVKMIGIRANELPEYYSQYDAFLYTGRGGDPFPITPLEAMLSRLPSILARDGGIQEIAVDGVNCLMFEADNAAALAKTIERFLALPDFGRSLATACTESLLVSHSLDNMAAVIESILSQACESAAESA